MAYKSILTILRDALPLFTCNFLQELNEKLSTDDHAIVRATATNKEEVKQWLEEFARVAGICYVVDKEHKAAKKAYRIDFICQHSDRNKSVKSDSRRLIEHKHKATGCKQRLYVSVHRVTPSVMRTERKKGESYVKQGLVATFSFTGFHNHPVLTADSGRFLRASTAVKNDITDKFKQGQAPSAVARQLKDECCEPRTTASVSNCPTNRQIYYLWDKFQQSEYALDPTTNTLENGQEVNVSSIIEPNPEVVCTKDTVLDTWREISAQFENKLGVLNDANWAKLKNSLDVFGQRLHNCNNDSQFNTFFRTTGGGIARLKRAGTMIGVQPTSKSRRASNRSRGNRTLSHGRNAKAVELLN